MVDRIAFESHAEAAVQSPAPRILVVDNYDSFTFNLVQYLGEFGASVEVYKNDGIDVDGVRARSPDAVLISPGPCTPNEAGVSLQLLLELGGTVPILGVCLGHQAIGQAYGGLRWPAVALRGDPVSFAARRASVAARLP